MSLVTDSQCKFGLHFSHSNKITHISKKSPLAGTPKIKSPGKGVKRALLIGINYYGTKNELSGCINDVKNINDILIGKFHYSKSHITILNDDPKTVEKLNPTRINILREMKKIISKTCSNDQVFIFYSGHGAQLTADAKDEKKNSDTPGKDDALCPCDFDKYENTDGFIVDNELRKILAEELPTGAKLRVFIDACHSASVIDLPYLYNSDKKDFSQIEPSLSNGNILSISGCKDSQTSADAYIGNKHSGALTWAILKGLNTALKIHTTWKELLLLTRHSLVEGKYEQVPMLDVGDKELIDLNIDL